jgi:hypothetical protein
MMIGKVDKYWLIRNKLCYLFDNKLCLDEYNIPIAKDDNILEYNSNLYLLEKGVLYEMDLTLYRKELVKIEKADNIEIIDKYYRAFKRIDRDNFVNEIYIGNQLIWSIQEPYWIKNPSSQFLFCKKFDKSNFFKRDIATGLTLWHFSVSDLGRYTDHEGTHEGKIDGHILESNGVLVLRVSGNRLIGIDNKNGKLLWEKKPKGNGFYYQNYKDELYILHENVCQLDPLTGEEKPLFPFFEELKRQKADDYVKILLTDKYLFSIGQWDLVILQWDKKTGELLWRHEIHPDKKKGRNGITLKGDILEPIQYGSGKLYVLDSTKTLHIFDRE